MEKEIFTDAIKLITKDCKDIVNSDKTYKQYLCELSEERLNDIINIYSSMQYDEEELKSLKDVLNNSREKKIDYLQNNINKILKLQLEVFPEDLIKEIYGILNKNGYVEYSINDVQFSLNSIIVLKTLGLIFINIEETKLKIHMPDCILHMLKKENLNDSIEDKNTITHFVQGLLNAYGMISIMEAYILITNLYKIISPEMFNRYIFFMANILNINIKADDIYMYNINLLDEDIPELEELHSRLEYHFYNLDEIKLLAQNNYYANYMQYKILQEFIEENLNISIDTLKTELLDWYIVLAQMDIEDAEEYMERKVEEFNLTNKNKQLLKQHIRDIYEICPKWKLKGGIKHKKNNDVKILQFPNS